MEKQYVRNLFDSIAPRYDLLNHLLSGGVDSAWRRTAVEMLRSEKPARILDVATGTADLALAVLALDPVEVVGIDMSEEMLERGRRKVKRRGAQAVVRLDLGDAEHLPYADGSFDAVTVAFGVRNFENLEAGLEEMRRVLRTGGTAIILEFSRPRTWLLRQLYFFYFLRILPLVGKAISKNAAAYRYLPATVLQFPEGREFALILERVGFRMTEERRLTGGIATIYRAVH